MALCVNGRTLSIAQMGRDFLVLEEQVEHPPTEAEITLSVDGRESRWPVRLVEGIKAGQWKTRIGPAHVHS